MSAIPREERILNLLSALLAAREPLPFSRIRGEVSGYDDDASPDALEKRFDRDKADLRGLGVTLEYVAAGAFGEAGYRVAKERFFLDEIRFTIEEGIVLAALQRDAVAGAGDALGASLKSALAKISVDSPLGEALRESVAEQQLLDARLPASGEEEGDCLASIALALASRRPVRFSYFTLGTGDVGTREVEPWGIGYFRGAWYLVGRDAGKDEERVFRTSRIRGEVEILGGEGYEIPEGFDLHERIGLPAWELREGRRVVARVRFAPELAFMIGENLRSGQSFTFAEDGSGVLAVPATDDEALVRWVAQYGSAAEILDPPELRDLMREHLEGLVARYAS